MTNRATFVRRYRSTTECAQEIGMSPAFIRRAIEEGRLPALVVTLGGRRRVYRIDEAVWLRVKPTIAGPATARRFER
jgi:hypothetical protein